MLVLTRRVDEVTVVGDAGRQVEVVVVGIQPGGRVQLGFRDVGHVGPTPVPVVRREVMLADAQRQGVVR
jgi:sRNA-binding carbon storage regulator CsrA